MAWPRLDLPVRPPLPPMEARLVGRLPDGDGWQFEPKWDGFRCLAFRDGDRIALQSKAGQPLGRYFPELVEALSSLGADRFVLDGEIVVPGSFDDLLQRIHPAATRIRRLAAETPAILLVFDLLVDAAGRSLLDAPLAERRRRLESFARRHLEGAGGRAHLSPATADPAGARAWFRELRQRGFDGVMAKRLDAPYRPGDRSAMQKVKWMRTADCVIGGFRMASRGTGLGSILLGLFGDDGRLHHVGFCANFTAATRRELERIVPPLAGGDGFTGRAPGGPSRWSSGRSTEWTPVDPVLVVEVQYDHFSGGRFRHGTKFLRLRPDKPPPACTLDQVEGSREARTPPGPPGWG